MEVSGKVKKVFETQTFDSGFRKRELIVTTEEQYPQHISIEFLQDKVDLLNDIIEGAAVKVSINLRGREWTNPEGVTRYFNSIVGWRLEKMDGQSASAPADMPSVPPVDMSSDSKGEDFDDLPF
ncbi:hypothetical protein UJ101_00754 [Flavobacteriaceae bacterium UJ101]|nr:hypothetical protein UJ101_00754 [Flavobacteriaceae bacterium UJ101]